MEELKSKKKYGIDDVAFATFLFVVFNLLFEGFYILFPTSFRASLVFVGIMQFLVEFLFAIVAFIIAKNRKANLFEAVGMKQKISGKLIWQALLISVVCLIFLGNLSNVFIEILNLFGYKSSASNIVIDNVGKYLVYVVCLAIAPAIFEEMLFRGTILNGLKSFGMKTALIVSALIFMIMHGNPDQTVHQFLIGLIIGYIFYSTGNLWIGIFVHFFNNFISLTELFVLTLYTNSHPELFESVTVTTSSAPTVFGTVLDVIYAVTFAVIGIVLITMILKKICIENDNVNKKISSDEVIVVDGKEQTVELSVDGEAINKASEGEKQIKWKDLSTISKTFFIVAGIVLVGTWILAFISGLL